MFNQKSGHGHLIFTDYLYECWSAKFVDSDIISNGATDLILCLFAPEIADRTTFKGQIETLRMVHGSCL